MIEPMNLITSLEHFLTYLRLHKGRSMRTLEQYEFHLWRLFTYMDPGLSKDSSGKLWDHREIFIDRDSEKRGANREARGVIQKSCKMTVDEVTKHTIDGFRLDLSKDDLSVKTINAHIITFRSWLKYLKKQEIPCLDPTVLDLMKPPDREVTFLTTEEIVRFFEAIPRDDIQ
jgi:site-specific recombinase XerD